MAKALDADIFLHTRTLLGKEVLTRIPMDW